MPYHGSFATDSMYHRTFDLPKYDNPHPGGDDDDEPYAIPTANETEHDTSLDEDIARRVGNAQMWDDGWVVPISQEDMGRVYDALRVQNAVETGKKEVEKVEARGLQVKDVLCK